MALGKTLEEIEAMPEAHFQEYELFYREQPFGLWREDYRTAQIAHLIAITNSDSKGRKPKLNDFMPFYHKDEEETEGNTVQAFLANRIENRL